jgi:hypothetical protein
MQENSTESCDALCSVLLHDFFFIRVLFKTLSGGSHYFSSIIDALLII